LDLGGVAGQFGGFRVSSDAGSGFQVGMVWMHCILFSYFMLCVGGIVVCEDIVHLAGFPGACEPWFPPESADLYIFIANFRFLSIMSLIDLHGCYPQAITSLHAASFFNAYKPRGAQSMTVGIVGIPNVGKRSVINIKPAV
jgi:hypothetical protein